uniref:Uncharacterized protein n=1 Tax=Dulem virus 90 TaxID=3145801 RepID=A0AAU8B2V0_9VIRU
MIENVNERTGEVVEFFTKYSYKSDEPKSFKDVVYQVDSTSHEPLEVMVKRVLRGQVLPRPDVYYDEHEDITETPGFDLADTGDIVSDLADMQAGEASEEQLTADAEASADKQAQQPKTESPAVSEETA